MRGFLEQWVNEAIVSALLETNTAVPAKIMEFNCAENTVKVQLSIKRKSVLKSPHYGEEESEHEPTEILEDIPVYVMRTSKYADTVPIEPGERCMLVFQQSSINCWWAKGHEEDTLNSIDTRRHHLSDAVALIGLWPQQEAIREWNFEWFERRTIDNFTRTAIKEGDGVWLQDLLSHLRLSRLGFDVWVNQASLLETLIMGFQSLAVSHAALATEPALINRQTYAATAAVCEEVVLLLTAIKGSVEIPEPEVCEEEPEPLECSDDCTQ